MGSIAPHIFCRIRLFYNLIVQGGAHLIKQKKVLFLKEYLLSLYPEKETGENTSFYFFFFCCCAAHSFIIRSCSFCIASNRAEKLDCFLGLALLASS